jgi:hypothetical protein
LILVKALSLAKAANSKGASNMKKRILALTTGSLLALAAIGASAEPLSTAGQDEAAVADSSSQTANLTQGDMNDRIAGDKNDGKKTSPSKKPTSAKSPAPKPKETAKAENKQETEVATKPSAKIDKEKEDEDADDVDVDDQDEDGDFTGNHEHEHVSLRK